MKAKLKIEPTKKQIQDDFTTPVYIRKRDEAPNFNQWFPFALNDVVNERYRQISKWGDNDLQDTDPYKILAILSEEHGYCPNLARKRGRVHAYPSTNGDG